MKKFKLPSILLFSLMAVLFANPGASHVVPEDELRNQVYLTDQAALIKVFEGVRKIKKEKRRISAAQQDRIEQISGQKYEDRRLVLFAAGSKDEKIFAVITRAYANSHPPTDAKYVVLIDSRGKVQDIQIMEYKGPQRAEIISRTFLDQYLGKSADSHFNTIVSNQGPTPSVQALNGSVHRTLAAFQVLFGKAGD